MENRGAATRAPASRGGPLGERSQPGSGSLHMSGCLRSAGGFARPASTLRKTVENGTSFQREIFNAGAGFEPIFDRRKPRSKMEAGGLGGTHGVLPQFQE
jgi:hypothetical protein